MMRLEIDILLTIKTIFLSQNVDVSRYSLVQKESNVTLFLHITLIWPNYSHMLNLSPGQDNSQGSVYLW